jgi:hypothetical protein
MLGLTNNLLGSTTTVDLKTLTTNLALWLQNGVGITSNVDSPYRVSQWNDSSGNSNHATQGAEGNQADLVSGGLDFEEGETDHYDFTSIAIANEGGFCMAWVQQSESSSINTLFSETNNEMIQIQNSSKLRLVTNGSGSGVTTQIHVDGTPFGNAKALFLLNRTAGSSGAFSVFKNGVELTIEPDSGDSTLADDGANTHGFSIDVLGSRSGADHNFDGKIFEIAFWQKSLSATEIAGVNSYLKSKHGL